VIPWRQNFICRRFGTHCLFHLYRRVSLVVLTPPVKMEQTEHSELLGYKIQAPGNHLKERIQHSKHSKSLKSRMIKILKRCHCCTQAWLYPLLTQNFCVCLFPYTLLCFVFFCRESQQKRTGALTQITLGGDCEPFPTERNIYFTNVLEEVSANMIFVI